MARLDCETVESIYSSLENILGFDRDVLDSRLAAFTKCKRTEPETKLQTLILDFITNNNKSRIFHDSTCWFHATRTHDAAGFRKGICPTNEMLDYTWSFLFSLVQGQISEKIWRKFRRQVETDCYGLGKMTFEAKRQYEQGPYGLLVRDNAFNRCDFGHDYLQTPELAEEICRCFKHQFRFDLQSIFFKNTKPCIVKFVSTPRDREEIGHALLFLLHKRGNNSNRRFPDWCFNGYGRSVSSKNIITVEWPAVP
jgi:hypothetical protein